LTGFEGLNKKDIAMNNDITEARWQQVGGQTRKWWGKLTDDDLEWIGGKAERLAHVLQEKYGYIQQHADSQSDRWMRDHQDDRAATVRQSSPRPTA
jgi:uncharacterized protein YjbJ (UPF0337 family)